MRFKMTSKNPFRNFVRNLRRITISNLNDKDKDILYRQLYKMNRSYLNGNEHHQIQKISIKFNKNVSTL